MIRWFKLCYLLFYFSIEFSFLIRYYSLLYQSLIPNCRVNISALRQHISISDNIEQYIVGAASHRTSCQRLINFLLTRLYSDKDYMQFCYCLNLISVMNDLPNRLIAGTYVCILLPMRIYKCIFLNQARAGWHVPGFLKLLLSGKSVCMDVCVSQAMKYYSREVKPE